MLLGEQGEWDYLGAKNKLEHGYYKTIFLLIYKSKKYI